MKAPFPQTPRVLCVDDCLELLSALQTTLTAYGFEVIAATNATEALERFHAHGGQFSCVLTDHALPGGTGACLAGQLRLAGYRGRIVVMSAELSPPDLAAYEKAGISGFFRKPSGLPGLLAMLRMPARVPGTEPDATKE